MNGGRNAAVGYLYQHLICVLDSFQDDWDSVIVEPHTDKEKVDILWLYETGREKYKKAVQVKSTQNIFNGEEILRIAEEIKNNFKDANEYELILIGSITRKLR
ncbi:hypothetical protein [Scytonema millei]|uniref:Uncharacterized protein n=1 Tax=Scytonema millei VB511283 TaxID=1245923 RepID=A0A9X5E8Y9_9CYAN|nr:hypothetical protein [Scytonema millei]NHC37550.1 hypothetical protein [Scytonema millei VB511283]